MKYKLKNQMNIKEKREIIVSLKDLEYMNNELKKDNRINGFVFGFEKIKILDGGIN